MVFNSLATSNWQHSQHSISTVEIGKKLLTLQQQNQAAVGQIIGEKLETGIHHDNNTYAIKVYAANKHTATS